MPDVFKKFLFSFLAFLVVFTSITPNFLSVKAASNSATDSATSTATWYSPGLFEFYSKVFDTSNNDIFGERYTYAQVVWIIESLPLAILGISASTFHDILQQVQSNPNGTSVLLDQGNSLAKINDPFTTIISQFYSSPPASGRYWLSQKINNFSLVKKAYAAPANSFGYSSLLIFEPLWSASRNIAYTLIVLILLAIAFAVMFRLKISPQVIVTVQSALPKIATTLILVTFSYAIVGFLIDLMYLIFGAIVYGIGNQSGVLASGVSAPDLLNNFLNGNLFTKIFTTAGTGGTVGIVGVVVGLIALVFTPIGPAIIPLVIGILIAGIIFFIKTFIMLAQTYLSLIMNLVFGPIIILAEAIPFIKASAVDWMRSVIADILVFLAVGLLFLAESLINGALSTTASTPPWSPPYLGFNANIFKIMIWVGVWSILPNIRSIVYKMMERSAAEIQLPREFSNLGETFQRGLGEYTGNTQFRDSFNRWLSGLRGRTGT
ncbi:MAG TPA: hypothetical protein VKC53_00555 [Patescibacteria group bacterium]|nr:hypothetical protein [Patescibacteria group bacterium]